MLDMLRRAVRSWVAKALLGLLVVSFAIWGVGDIGQGFSTNVATVGERTISVDDYARVLRREVTRFGMEPAQIRQTGLDRYVLAAMVREAAFEEAARALGVSAPDSAVARQVRADPTFQSAGSFDAVQYESVVRRAWGSVGDYEERVRRSLAAGPLRAAAVLAPAAPVGVAESIARRQGEERRFDAVTLGPDAVTEAVPEPTDAQLAAHLEENAAAFRAPERRAVTWLHIDVDALAADVDTPEADLRALYEARRDIYVADERRSIDQIVYLDPADAEAARERLDAGEIDFDGLLAERNLSRADAALGDVTQEDLGDARGEAAFALDAPGVAGPVPTATGGAALLEVTEITPGVVTPFEDARDDLARELGADAARPEADRLAEEVADLAAAGATLEEIGAELGLEVRSVSGLTATGATGDGGPAQGLAGAPTFLDEAFTAEIGEERNLRDAPDGGYFILRVDAVEEAETPPLDQIRDLVADGWRAEARREALADLAEEALGRIEAGESLATVAEDLGASVSTIGPLRSDDPDPRLDAAARETLFTGDIGAAAVTVRGQRATLAVLAEIIDPEDVAAQAAAIERALAESVAQDQLEYLGRALEAEAGATFNQQALDAVVSQIGG
jgi:peptidyl-prolyl cis-trans isomerase D